MKLCRTHGVVLTVLVAAACSHAATRHVWSGGTHTYPFTSWATAAHDIPSAFHAAGSGDDVLVTNGLYALTETLTNDTGIAVRSVNGREVTTIDCGGVRRAFVLRHATAIVDGFAITNGYDNYDGNGGAIL